MWLQLRLITTNGLFGFQCCCRNHTVWTFTLNAMQLIRCDKNRNRTMWTSLNAQFLRVSFYYFDKTRRVTPHSHRRTKANVKSDDSVLVINFNCGAHFKWTNCQALLTCNVFQPVSVIHTIIVQQCFSRNHVNDGQNKSIPHSLLSTLLLFTIGIKITG